jgi:thioredoxin-dependent peroxiredoxin
MLQIGDLAPDFEVKDQNGHVVRMSDFKGKKVVLYFYPKDDTPGCTAQACNLRDNYDALLAKGFVVLGVSVDNEKSHQKFVQKFDLPFPLLADTEHEIVEKYGVWQEKSMYGRKYMGTMRYTFVINEEGTIEDIITKVDTKNHTAQLLK